MSKSKRIVSIVMVVILLGIGVMQPLQKQQKQADADALGWALALTGTAGGLTVGGAIALVVGAVALTYCVSVAIDDWDNITNNVARGLDKAKEKGGEVADWWTGLTSAAENIDTGSTIEEDIENDKFTVYTNYKIDPNNNKKPIFIPPGVTEYIKDTIKEEKDWDNFEPGKPTIDYGLEKVMNEYYNLSVSALQPEIENFKYHYILKNYLISTNEPLVYQAIFNGYDFKNTWDGHYVTINIGAHSNEEIVYTHHLNDRRVIDFGYRYGSSIYGLNNDYKRLYFKKNHLTQNWAELPTINDINNVRDAYKSIYKYSSVPMEVNILNELKPRGDYINTNLNKEAYQYTLGGPEIPIINYSKYRADIKDGITIYPDDKLIDRLANLDITKIGTTDGFLTEVVEADKEARKEGRAVFSEIIEDYEPEDNEPELPDNPSVDVPDGWFSGVITWLENIYNGILDIPNKLKSFKDAVIDWLERLYNQIVNLGSIILDAIKGALSWLFVPDAALWQDKLQSWSDKFNDNYGLLTLPISLVIMFLTGLYNTEHGQDAILTIPKLEFKGYKLYDGCEYNMTQAINNSMFADLRQYLHIVTNFMIIVWVVNLALKKGKEIMQGG